MGVHPASSGHDPLSLWARLRDRGAVDGEGELHRLNLVLIRFDAGDIGGLLQSPDELPDLYLIRDHVLPGDLPFVNNAEFPNPPVAEARHLRRLLDRKSVV